MYWDCFAFECKNGKCVCGVLEEMLCCTGPCGFHQTGEQLHNARLAAQERISELPEDLQAYIKQKYKRTLREEGQ